MSIPKHLTAAQGHVEAIRTLVEFGGNVNGAWNGGYIPMHLAAAQAQVEGIRTLVELGGDASETGNGGFTFCCSTGTC